MGAAQLWTRRLLGAATLLALAVVILGAYVRLRDAGLGCPDWPGCYGQLIGVPEQAADGSEIEHVKAWIEVAHRYLAGGFGLLVLAAAALAWARPAPAAIRWLCSALVLLVLVQAGLGALTVTELLKPAIVTSHLLGGLAILAALSAYSVRAWRIPGFSAGGAPGGLLAAAAAVLVAQIALGGWVSTNYAGLACGTDFPACGGSLLPPADAGAFALDRELGRAADGSPLTQRALAAVHQAHRIGALAATLLLAALAAALWRRRLRTQAVTLISALSLQLGLGIYIVIAALPLYPSLLHNAGAALLCMTMAAIASAPSASDLEAPH